VDRNLREWLKAKGVKVTEIERRESHDDGGAAESGGVCGAAIPVNVKKLFLLGIFVLYLQPIHSLLSRARQYVAA